MRDTLLARDDPNLKDDISVQHFFLFFFFKIFIDRKCAAKEKSLKKLAHSFRFVDQIDAFIKILKDYYALMENLNATQIYETQAI